MHSINTDFPLCIIPSLWFIGIHGPFYIYLHFTLLTASRSYHSLYFLDPQWPLFQDLLPKIVPFTHLMLFPGQTMDYLLKDCTPILVRFILLLFYMLMCVCVCVLVLMLKLCGFFSDFKCDFGVADNARSGLRVQSKAKALIALPFAHSNVQSSVSR